MWELSTTGRKSERKWRREWWTQPRWQGAHFLRVVYVDRRADLAGPLVLCGGKGHTHTSQAWEVCVGWQPLAPVPTGHLRWFSAGKRRCALTHWSHPLTRSFIHSFNTYLLSLIIGTGVPRNEWRNSCLQGAHRPISLFFKETSRWRT